MVRYEPLSFSLNHVVVELLLSSHGSSSHRSTARISDLTPNVLPGRISAATNYSHHDKSPFQKGEELHSEPPEDGGGGTP